MAGSAGRKTGDQRLVGHHRRRQRLRSLLRLHHYEPEPSFRGRITDAHEAFASALERQQPRLFAVIITDSGRPTEPPIGIVTPWDLLGDPESKERGLSTKDAKARDLSTKDTKGHEEREIWS